MQNFRGNFLASIGRVDEHEILSSITKHWDSFQSSYLVETIQLPVKGNDIPKGLDLSHFGRSDHAKFWMVNSESYPDGLKAVLITDTGTKQIMFHHQIKCFSNKDIAIFFEKSNLGSVFCS